MALKQKSQIKNIPTNNFINMKREILKDAIKGLFEGEQALICPDIAAKHRKELHESSGNAEEELSHLDSSTLLAVNFFTLFEKSHPKAKVNFEWKGSSPLKVGGKSNLDVRVEYGNNIDFYESKYLEPYYMNNSAFTESYYKKELYRTSFFENESDLKSVLQHIVNIKYYNASQLFRHLIAISNHIASNINYYSDKTVRLISATWKMPESFKNALRADQRFSKRSETYLVSRISVLNDEKGKTEAILDNLINTYIRPFIDDVDLSFKVKTYNDMISEVEDSGNEYESFLRRYIL